MIGASSHNFALMRLHWVVGPASKGSVNKKSTTLIHTVQNLVYSLYMIVWFIDSVRNCSTMPPSGCHSLHPCIHKKITITDTVDNGSSSNYRSFLQESNKVINGKLNIATLWLGLSLRIWMISAHTNLSILPDIYFIWFSSQVCFSWYRLTAACPLKW